MQLPGGGDELFCARLIQNHPLSGVRRAKASSGNSTTDDDSNSGDDGDANVSTTIQAKVLRCPVQACGPNNTCLQNRTGPVCGYCQAGFVMETAGCSNEVCPSEEELAPWRYALMVSVGTVVLLLYIGLACRPVLPELDWLIARALQGLVGMGSACVCFRDTHGDTGEGAGEIMGLATSFMNGGRWFLGNLKQGGAWWKENQAGQYLKILITYFQILGSFTMFTIQWPDIAFTMITSFKTAVKFELVQMPGLSCVLAGYSSFENTLYMYTIGPLIFIIALALPMLAAIFRGYKKSGSYRWRHSQDKFWTKCVLVCVYVCACACVLINKYCITCLFVCQNECLSI